MDDILKFAGTLIRSIARYGPAGPVTVLCVMAAVAFAASTHDHFLFVAFLGFLLLVLVLFFGFLLLSAKQETEAARARLAVSVAEGKARKDLLRLKVKQRALVSPGSVESPVVGTGGRIER